MPRFLQRSLITILDVVGLSLAYWLAFLFRFEFVIPREVTQLILVNWAWVVGIHYLGLYVLGVPRMSWRYMTMRDTVRIAVAVGISSTLLLMIRVVLPLFSEHQVVFLPLGVLAMDVVLAFVGLVAARAIVRLRGEVLDRNKRAPGGDMHPVLLIGAGEAGVVVAREIANRPDLGLKPVGFLDDDRMKVGTSIGGLTVLGVTSQLKAIAEEKQTKRALITIANASGHQIRRITELCRDADLETKIIPGIYEIVGEKVNLSRIREVAIEDLLGREPVQLDEEVVGATIRSRIVLVTGAGGSIGSELCRQVCRFGPARIILVERFENALFEIHRELTAAFPHVPMEPRIADVTDVARMRQIFEASKPELVFHAAAHKHVPMMEWNAGEAVKNNIGGTRAVADLAHEHGVERFVLISTDKAVNPTSVMGATKRVAEIYIQALSQRSETRFVTVRFGNVLGSAGSVVPIFREQIAKGGPITVTHPEMTRYFMTIPEASQLVLQAGAMGDGGEIFILDMGEPVRIVDLARDLITLSGLRPNDDIEIRFSGMRPGEKLYEELATDSEHADKTKHPKVFIGRIKPHAWDSVIEGVAAVSALASAGNIEHIRAALADIVPEFRVTRASRTSLRTSETLKTLEAIEPAPRDRSTAN
ncbi:MAG TPA: nucleoside-diphosphate sugar epimerase/dehydratase [Kofleriaceae bacterium]|nr:nucleoside-diphosphate sugar epimerase/dehydratase [Kofleriaceae bacterium]